MVGTLLVPMRINGMQRIVGKIQVQIWRTDFDTMWYKNIKPYIRAHVEHPSWQLDFVKLY